MQVPSDFKELYKYSFRDYAFWHSPSDLCVMDRNMPIFITGDDRLVISAWESCATANEFPWGFKLDIPIDSHWIEISGVDFPSPQDAFEVARAALAIFLAEGKNSPHMPSDLLIEEV